MGRPFPKAVCCACKVRRATRRLPSTTLRAAAWQTRSITASGTRRWCRPVTAGAPSFFPTLPHTAGRLYLSVERDRYTVVLDAADLAAADAGARRYDFLHLTLALGCALTAVVALVLGVVGRDGRQFLFALLFAWLVIGEWAGSGLALTLTPQFPAAVWLNACFDPVSNCLGLLMSLVLIECRRTAPRLGSVLVVIAFAPPAGDSFFPS